MTRLIALLIVFIAGEVIAAEDEGPVVGAIRWDAWTGGSMTEEVARTLGPKKYHDRLPWFAEVVDSATVRIDGSSQEIMDREIEIAASAGLDYWAFLAYPESSTMSTAVGQYLRSQKRKQIRFCLILHNSLSAADDQWPKERDRLIRLIKEPGYQKVLDARPLVYAFTGGDFPFHRFSDFLRAARREKLNPYCVYMYGDPGSDFKKASKHGFDAVSAYAIGGNQPTFAGLVQAVETGLWQNAVRAKVPFVPMVTTGWDKWPRKDNPVSWEKGQAYLRQKVFPSRATPVEIAGHMARSLAFVEQHPKICRARAIIVYAWNEYDEGGWLAPTRAPAGGLDRSRLDAIRQVLRVRNQPSTRPKLEASGNTPRSRSGE